MPRLERDALGELSLPDEAYYGVQTARAVANFPVSGLREPPELIRAGALVKKAAALANVDLGVLDPGRGDAIVRAAGEIFGGDLSDQFPVDVFQAGAGTSFNMNLNEVIANRALELLGKNRGDYTFLGPNDHVNLGQSSNDVFPTICHLATIAAADRLLPALARLTEVLEGRAREFADIVKVGRTHLMEALPVTLGQEFSGYATAVRRATERLGQRRDDLLEVAIGGTAVGTGVGTHPHFRATVIARLSELAGIALRPARNAFEALQSRGQLAAFSGSLKELATELGRIANDLRLLGSGPFAGLGEIRLPAVQPGSSIMPGKVNPSLAECLSMVCFQAVGNDTAVTLAAQAGQLELNVMAPVMVHNILSSTKMLAGFLPVFTDKCVAGITADEERCRANLDLNPALAALLVPRIGYLAAARLAQEAVDSARSVFDLAVEEGLLARAEADQMRETANLPK